MSNNWVKDIEEMHTHYGINKAVRKMTGEQLKSFLEFRVKFLEEELNELKVAMANENKLDSVEIVDALIDLCVVAIGTLDAFDVNAYRAWDAVHSANMQKIPGIKPSRPNPHGLPDLIKPEGWVAPDHSGNVGLIESCYK